MMGASAVVAVSGCDAGSDNEGTVQWRGPGLFAAQPPRPSPAADFDDSDWYYYVRVPRSDVPSLHQSAVGFVQDEVADDTFAFGYLPKARTALLPDAVASRLVLLDMAATRSTRFDAKTLVVKVEPEAVQSAGEGMHNSVALYEAALDNLVARFPGSLRKYAIGSSVLGKRLWVVRASTTPSVTQEKTVKLLYVANIHGDETVGREHMLKLIELIGSCWSGACYDSQGVDATMASLVSGLRGRAEITIMPVMNPDGSLRSSPARFNANGIDLNRNFPDVISARQHGANNLPGPGYPWQRWSELTDPAVDMTDARFEPEVAAVIGVLSKRRLEAQDQPLPNPFVLGATLHAGSQVVNLPWDDQRSGSESSGGSSLCANVESLFGSSPPFPADMYVKGVARELANGNSDLRDDNDDPSFYDGVTYGCEWYPFYDGSKTGSSGKGYQGGIQDFFNIYRNSVHVTVEQSVVKDPSWAATMALWLNQRLSLATFLSRGLEGLHLHVVGPDGQGLSGAWVTVAWPYSASGRPFASAARTIRFPNASYLHIGAGVAALASPSAGDLAHSGYNDADEARHLGYLNGAGQGVGAMGALPVTVCVPGYAKASLSVSPSVFNGTDFRTVMLTRQAWGTCP